MTGRTVDNTTSAPGRIGLSTGTIRGMRLPIGGAPQPENADKPVVMDLYCRISRAIDGRGGYRSVEDQEADGRATVAGHAADEWVVGRVFRDPAKSGWNPKVVRPEWDEMMTRLESGAAGGVWVYDLTRFTRKPKEGERLIQMAERGIIVASLSTTFDLMTANGKKSFREDIVHAAFESDKNSERSTRGKRLKAERGESNAPIRGFGVPGFAPNPKGWKPGDPRVVVPDECVRAEQEVVRDVARQLLVGVTLDAVTRKLCEEGISTVNGNPWTAEHLGTMLRRPSLAGLVDRRGELIAGRVLPFDPALDRQTWEALQGLFASRRRGRPPSKYILSGLMRCGGCGERMYGRPRPNRKRYPDGEVAREYQCKRTSHGAGCGLQVIDQRYADDAVERAVVGLLGNPRHAAQIAKRAASVETESARLSAQLAEAEQVSLNQFTKLGLGEHTQEQHDACFVPLQRRIAGYKARLATLAGDGAELAPVQDIAADWKLGLCAQRRLVERAFPRLTLLPATSRREALSPSRFDWQGETLPGAP